LFEANPNVTTREWEDYTRSLDIKSNYPGLMDLGYAQRVRPSDIEIHAAAMRSRGGGNYQIQPDGNREEYYPLIHLSTPTTVRNWVPGWDAYSETNRRTAIEKAIATDNPISTGKVLLFSPTGTNDEAGFILYLPISKHVASAEPGGESKSELAGVAFASFRAREFGRRIFESQRADAIDIEVYDSETPARENSLFDTDGTMVAGIPNSSRRFSRTIQIPGLGRIWSLNVSTLPAFELDSQKHLTAMSLVAGVTVSVLLFSIALMQARARLKAEGLSEDLRQSEESLRNANRSLMDKIAARQQAEMALAAEKERLSVTLRSIGEGVVTTDAAGEIRLMNASAERLTGWTQSGAIGKPLAEVFHLIEERSREACVNLLERVLGTDPLVSLGMQAILRSRDGTERIVMTSGAPMRDPCGYVVGVVLVFRDMTESRKLETELHRSSKLESLGILAGGIAHDFNNILTAILGNISLTRMQLEDSSPAHERLDKAEASCHRARELTNQLLTFARGGAPVKKTKSITQLVKDAGDLSVIGSNVRCEFALAPELWPADVDGSQITQVLNNILINAVQAMPDGGIIHVTAVNVPGGIRIGPAVRAGNHIRISIQDHGPGIPSENIARVFDPFFTTKHRSRGLGLATAYSIIRKHEGHIEVESKPGKGATFHIYLPASTRSAGAATDHKSKVSLGTGRVLVMDDEPDIQNLSKAVLKRLGYEAEVASDGVEALDKYREALKSGRPFVAVIMDLTIPGGMGGKEAMRHFLEFDPNVRAIVSSGYSNDPVMADYQSYGFSGVVAKPYQISDLAKTLKEVSTRCDPSPSVSSPAPLG
jgi:PAS domain S-box-containing protein